MVVVVVEQEAFVPSWGWAFGVGVERGAARERGGRGGRGEGKRDSELGPMTLWWAGRGVWRKAMKRSCAVSCKSYTLFRSAVWACIILHIFIYYLYSI